VELHGGRVWVKSEFGSGSKFSFTIPLTQALKMMPSARTGSVGRSVLLIDDEPLTLAAMGNALRSRGYRVLMADSGTHGLEIVRQNSPDMIVLDLIMSDMSGFDVAERLRQDDTSAQIPVLVLTAMDLSADDRARLTEKVWRIAEKGSLSTHELVSLVESALAAAQPPVTGGSRDVTQDPDR